LFSDVISEHFSENRMIISLVAAKIRYPKNVRFLGHPVRVGHELVVYNVFRGVGAALAPTDVATVKYGVILVPHAVERLSWTVHKATEQHLVVCQSRMFTFLHRKSE